TDIVIEKANKNNIAVAASRHCNHIGRLGSYTQRVAQTGLFGFAAVNSSRHGHFVAPFGGAEGRLATNPLSYAVPTKGDPILLDTSTSMVSEGKIRVLMHQGKKLPENCILTSDGRPTNIPEEFYKPKKGTILPFGGEMGYKGFGLGLLVEILGSTFSGVALTPDGEKDEYINGFFIMAINPEVFGIEKNEIIKNMEALKKYIKSAKQAQGSKGIFMPGELDFNTRTERLTDGIEVANETWKQIANAAKLFNVVL
ncbi:MAG: Ldh family oxidoreductase, partial [Actinobacteria bacterium]|nr:Ldh family oxidoreductase [Actinomycetota bacterium]